MVILYVGSPAALVFTVLQWVDQLLKLLMRELEYISPQVPVLDPDLLNIFENILDNFRSERIFRGKQKKIFSAHNDQGSMKQELK